MQRKIKFRFWNGNKMLQPEKWADVLIKGDGRIFTWIDIAENSGLSEDEDGRIIPMQYIGIKDKNKKKIFESDIVRYTERGSVGSFLTTGTVVWDRYGWNVDNFYNAAFDCPGCAFSEPYEFEVIGNIYENPELLMPDQK